MISVLDAKICEGGAPNETSSMKGFLQKKRSALAAKFLARRGGIRCPGRGRGSGLRGSESRNGLIPVRFLENVHRRIDVKLRTQQRICVTFAHERIKESGRWKWRAPKCRIVAKSAQVLQSVHLRRAPKCRIVAESAQVLQSVHVR